MNRDRARLIALCSPVVEAGDGGYDAQFDQGSAASIAADGEDQRITTIQHWDSKWAWFAIRGRKMTGLTPSFVTAKANHYNLAAGTHLAMYATSPDTDDWTDFDNVTIGDTDIEFYNDTAFNASTVYIAHCPMYPFSRTQRKMVEWLASDLVSDTPSSTNGIIGYATARDSDDGRGITVPALPFYGFKISSGAGTKNIAILTSGNHPHETPGRFVFEAAIDWLLTDSVYQNFLLDYFDFYCYPCLNPQGVYAGYFRSSPETPDDDNNRLWDGAEENEAIDAFKAAMLADTGGTVEIGFDYHSEVSSADIFAVVQPGDTEGAYATYLDKLNDLDADFDLSESDVTTGLRYLLKDTYSAALAMSIEQGLETARNVAEYLTYGEQTLEALIPMLAAGAFTNSPGIGCRDFNGTTDRIDWAAVANLTGSALTISAWIYSDGVAGNSDYIFEIHASGDAALGMQFYLSASTGLYYQRGSGATSVYRGVVVDNVASAWHHVLVTHDGTLGDYTTIHLYQNGAEKTTAVTNQNGSSVADPTGSWSIGGRIYDDQRNFDGKIAQVGVWNRVLGSTEIANLAAGYAPSLAAASGLQFYWKGNTASLANEITSTDGTADGTSQVTGAGNGPPVIY